jgi:hypothetical protein
MLQKSIFYYHENKKNNLLDFEIIRREKSKKFPILIDKNK